MAFPAKEATRISIIITLFMFFAAIVIIALPFKLDIVSGKIAVATAYADDDQKNNGHDDKRNDHDDIKNEDNEDMDYENDENHEDEDIHDEDDERDDWNDDSQDLNDNRGEDTDDDGNLTSFFNLFPISTDEESELIGNWGDTSISNDDTSSLDDENVPEEADKDESGSDSGQNVQVR